MYEINTMSFQAIGRVIWIYILAAVCSGLADTFPLKKSSQVFASLSLRSFEANLTTNTDKRMDVREK